MAECFKCGISDKNAQLFDAITKEGLVKICEGCSAFSDFPILRRPTAFQLKEIERKPTTYERLSRMSGLKNLNERKVEKSDYLIRQEKSLRAMVDKNYAEKIKQEAKPRPDLVDNFHWIIMRARRSKHVTQKQMADAIGEAEAAIKMAEEGILPENNYLLNKIQGYLEINLLKETSKMTMENTKNSVHDFVPTPFLDLGKKNPDELTIFDLKEVKKKADKDLSEEEIRKLIFKK
jgi:ribosome-binding protein aMBF1 (putative translation factor)